MEQISRAHKELLFEAVEQLSARRKRVSVEAVLRITRDRVPREVIEAYLNYIMSPPRSVVQPIKTPPLSDIMLEVWVSEQLEAHGGWQEVRADHCLVHVPEGTTRQEMPYRTQKTRYIITFPDGYELYQEEMRDSISLLYFPLKS